MIISDFDNLVGMYYIYGWTFERCDAKMIIIKEPFIHLKHFVLCKMLI